MKPQAPSPPTPVRAETTAGASSPPTGQTPVAAIEEPVKAAEGIKQAVASENQTIGGVIERLDSFAVDAGSTHISLWSALVVMMIVAAVIIFARLGTKLAHWVLARMTRLDSTQRLLIEKLAAIVVWVVAILVGLDILDIDLTALTVFSGAFGLALGFGLQKTFGNLISGIILLMDRSIKPGDVIGIADQAGGFTFGQIRRIGIRAVSIVTRDEKEYLIPNENLMINQVENWSYSSRDVRIQVPVGVSYKADIFKAEQLMLEAARSTGRVLAVPEPSVWLDSFADSSVNFIIHCWIMDPEEGIGNVKSEVLKRLWVLFRENGIEIPFPQRDLNLRDSAALRELMEALRDDAPKSASDDNAAP